MKLNSSDFAVKGTVGFAVQGVIDEGRYFKLVDFQE